MDNVKVIFRAERSGPHKGEVTAVFPDYVKSEDRFTIYAHIGQHGTGSFGWYYKTRPAKPDEYASLLSELKQIYETGEDAVTLQVAQRFPSRN